MSSQDEQPQTSSLLHRLLKNLSLDWLSLAFDLTKYLRKWLCSSPSGPYEILDYESTFELVDTAGKTVIFKKRQRVEFLQDHIIAFEDYAWGDGKIFEDYKCSPGVIVDQYREGDRWNILISLRETKNRGDIVEFYIERKIENGFTKAEEWQQAEIRRATRHLRMNVIFPKKRHCQRAVLIERKSNQVLVLSAEHFTILPDGRQLVTWETTHVRSYNVYTLKWKW